MTTDAPAGKPRLPRGIELLRDPLFHQEGLDEKLVEKLNIWTGRPNLKGWERVVKKMKHPRFESYDCCRG